jgi:acyl-CoA synthetase (AMP-forming)/AMP-acid ligase II
MAEPIAESLLLGSGSSEAVVEATSGMRVTYDELRVRTADLARTLLVQNADRQLAFLYASNTLDSILLYLASLEAAIPLVLVEPREANLLNLLKVYSPALVFVPSPMVVPDAYERTGTPLELLNYCCIRKKNGGISRGKCHEKLALLLQTSGSTGSPKLVRLTRRNLLSNASSIARYLELGPAERSIQGLPMHYSYGLSLINSHLIAGGTIVLTPHSFMMGEFWGDFAANRCSSFAGVPFMYETLHRIGFHPSKYPTLRTMTQAGGGLRKDLISHFCDTARKADIKFFVMYGQTEATARISYVPFLRLPEKIGSIGIAIPDGEMTLEPIEGLENAQELIYRGPNVMMGYAEGPDALAEGDLLEGELRTGDLVSVDSEGYFFLTGRLGRFAKLFGNRINLADVENYVERTHNVETAALEGTNALILWIVPGSMTQPDVIKRNVASFLGVIPSSIEIRLTDALPRTQAGKKDYRALGK